jgi:hypothetical protein
LNLFLFAYWMPTVLTLIGLSPPQAVFASSLRDLNSGHFQARSLHDCQDSSAIPYRDDFD